MKGPQKTRTYVEVEQLLRENAVSRQTGVSPRDSDNELFIQVLQRHRGANLSAEQLNIIRSVKYESISRARRKLQAEGKYLPSPEVARHRRIKGAELQQTAPSESAAGVQRRIETNGKE